jgi:hypothetical protein
MAAAIAAAATSNKFDCMVLGISDSIFAPIIRRYIAESILSCGIIFIQEQQQPTREQYILSTDFLSLFNHWLRFDTTVLKMRRDGEQRSTT